MGNALEVSAQPVTHRAKVGIECPLCHWKQLIEVQLEQPQINHPLAMEIRRHLEAWMGSRCPDHLNAISGLSKN
ncbi:MAG: hypothetical protein ACRD3D_11265 [Terriglobia bacterium]